MSDLEQPTAFRPLVRKPIILAAITVRAGNHKVRRVIATAASHRYNMVNMVTAPQLFPAIVAFAFLSLILLSDIFSSVVPFGVAKSSAAVAGIGLHSILAPVLIPLLHPRSRLLFRLAGLTWLLASSAIASLAFLSLTLAAVGRKLISSRMVTIEESGQKEVVTCTASLLAVNVALTRLPAFSKARFTARSQPILTLIMGIEELKCSRERLSTDAARFKGNIIHNLNCLSFSCLVFAGCQGNKAIPSSHRVITPMLCSHHLIIPFFATASKAERREIFVRFYNLKVGVTCW